MLPRALPTSSAVSDEHVSCLRPGSARNCCTNTFFFHFLASHQVPEKPMKSIKSMEKEIINLKKDLARSRWVSPARNNPGQPDRDGRAMGWCPQALARSQCPAPAQNNVQKTYRRVALCKDPFSGWPTLPLLLPEPEPNSREFPCAPKYSVVPPGLQRGSRESGRLSSVLAPQPPSGWPGGVT